MQTIVHQPATNPYVHIARASRRARWEIDRDVIRDRSFDPTHTFLPDGLSLVDRLVELTADERRFLGQIQGRTYANIFGLVERFINAKVLELAREHVLGDQAALEGLIGFSEEELKHQELFRRIEALAGDVMPPGYAFMADPDDVARAVLASSTWAVLALTLHIELFTQLHYQASIDPVPALSPLFKDVFRFHWKEEARHAVIDEIELRRCHAALGADERDRAVTDFIDLVVAVDGILGLQAASDARYFVATRGDDAAGTRQRAVEDGLLAAYRWQYILSGAAHPHFAYVLGELLTPAQLERIGRALATLR
ncbi:MAG: diiron oxygenase [Deltaproteobacteria bacterium]|nr:diiron oxygenase [Kofleriaceae bacterium]